MAQSIAQMYHQYVGRKALLIVLKRREMCDRDGNVIRESSIGVRIPVQVVDARIVYGTAHVLIRPYRGEGSTWVLASKVHMVDEWPEEHKNDGQQSAASELTENGSDSGGTRATSGTPSGEV